MKSKIFITLSLLISFITSTLAQTAVPSPTPSRWTTLTKGANSYREFYTVSGQYSTFQYKTEALSCSYRIKLQGFSSHTGQKYPVYIPVTVLPSLSSSYSSSYSCYCGGNCSTKPLCKNGTNLMMVSPSFAASEISEMTNEPFIYNIESMRDLLYAGTLRERHQYRFALKANYVAENTGSFTGGYQLNFEALPLDADGTKYTGAVKESDYLLEKLCS